MNLLPLTIPLTVSLFFSLAFIVLIVSLLRPFSRGVDYQEIQGLSLIIPFRNEEKNLTALISSLAEQKCSVPLEVILINDGSDDNSLALAQSLDQQFPQLNCTITTTQFSSTIPLTSKQQALDVGVSRAKYNYLVFTDADMFYSSRWLQSLVDSAEKSKGSFIFGRTAIKVTSGFSWLQNIQLTTLFAVAWLFAKGGIKSSCMGNNILLRKDLYTAIGGQMGIGYTIVEDQGLLAKLKEIGTTPQPTLPFSAKAFTYAETSLKGYAHQMLRWAKGGAKGSLLLSLAMTLLGGFFLFGTAVMLWADPKILALPLALLLLYLSIGFYAIRVLRHIWVLPVVIVWIGVQIVFLPLALLTLKPQWKGRKI